MARHDLLNDAIELLGKEAVEAIQDTGRASKWNKSRINQEIRNAMKGAAGDNAIQSVIPFKPDDAGQWTIKGAEPNPIIKEGAKAASDNSPIPGQISMFDNSGAVFQDSTGQYHTPSSKRSQIKEARQSRQYSEGDGGQMYMSFGGKSPEPQPGQRPIPSVSDVSEANSGKFEFATDDTSINWDTSGQQSFLDDGYGNLTTVDAEAKKRVAAKERAAQVQEEYNKQYPPPPTQAQHDARQAEYDAFGQKLDEMDKANRGWRERTIDGVKERATGVWNTVSGKNRKEVTANRRAYNQQVANEGKGDYIKSNSEYRRMQKQYAKSGADTPETMYENIMKAQENSSNGLNWDGIAETIKDNQLLVAGGLIGGGLVVSSLMDDDY